MYNHESDLTNFGTWLHDNKDKMFRYWVKKTMFTPYEQEKKFFDQSVYEDDTCSYGYFETAIELPDGDILVCILDAENENNEGLECRYYYKLSEIHFMYLKSDQR